MFWHTIQLKRGNWYIILWCNAKLNPDLIENQCLCIEILKFFFSLFTLVNLIWKKKSNCIMCIMEIEKRIKFHFKVFVKKYIAYKFDRIFILSGVNSFIFLSFSSLLKKKILSSIYVIFFTYKCTFFRLKIEQK